MKIAAIIVVFWMLVIGMTVLTYTLPLVAALIEFVAVTAVMWIVVSGVVQQHKRRRTH